MATVTVYHPDTGQPATVTERQARLLWEPRGWTRTNPADAKPKRTRKAAKATDETPTAPEAETET